VWAYLQDLDLRDSTVAGLAAASITLESGDTVHPAMSATALKLRMSEK
jgi:pseudouridine kinase